MYAIRSYYGIGVEDIRAVANQRQHALVTNRDQFLFGCRLADDRLFVELPVACVEHSPMRRVDQQRVAFRDRVRQRNVLV